MWTWIFSVLIFWAVSERHDAPISKILTLWFVCHISIRLCKKNKFLNLKTCDRNFIHEFISTGCITSLSLDFLDLILKELWTLNLWNNVLKLCDFVTLAITMITSFHKLYFLLTLKTHYVHCRVIFEIIDSHLKKRRLHYNTDLI